MIRTNKELFEAIFQLNQFGAAELFSTASYAAGEEILIQGKKVFNVYIIKSGITKCFLCTDTGKTFIQEFFGEGEMFGEIEAIDNSYSSCTIQAVTEVIVYQIKTANFLQLLQENKHFNSVLIKALTAKLKYKAIRHSYNQSHTIEENLLRLKTTFPELEKVISKRDIAAYLGITLRALNRTIKTLNDNGTGKISG